MPLVLWALPTAPSRFLRQWSGLISGTLVSDIAWLYSQICLKRLPMHVLGLQGWLNDPCVGTCANWSLGTMVADPCLCPRSHRCTYIAGVWQWICYRLLRSQPNKQTPTVFEMGCGWLCGQWCKLYVHNVTSLYVCMTQGTCALVQLASSFLHVCGLC